MHAAGAAPRCMCSPIADACGGCADHLIGRRGRIQRQDRRWLSHRFERDSLHHAIGNVDPLADNALILNLEESGLSGHRLTNSSYAVGVVRGMTSDSPPAKHRPSSRRPWPHRFPTTTLGGTSGSESADTTTWSKATDGSPVNVYLVGRVVYNAAGDQTLYSFVRMLSFDARGLLVSIGAETRVTVDVTEACA